MSRLAILFLAWAGAAVAAETGQIQQFKLPRLPLAPLAGTQNQSKGASSNVSTVASVELLRSAGGFLRVEGIAGPVTDKRYTGWINVLSVAQGIDGAGSAVSTGAGRSRFRPLTVTKPIDSASVPLLRAAAAGQHLARVDLVLTGGPGNVELYRVDLEDVVITRLDTVMQDGTASEELELAFARIRWQFRLYGPSGQGTGTLDGCWDVGANRGC